MSKVTDLGLNLVPTRLPKKNIVETAKAEEIASKIHATTPESTLPEEKNVKTETSVVKTKEIKPQKSILPQTVSVSGQPENTVKKRAARTLIEDPDAVRKTSFDFPVALYRSMKILLAEEGISMRDYVIGLIEADLNNK